MSARVYPTETVECPSCDGTGERLGDVPDVYVRCYSCFGRGTVEVCANCLDWDEDCSVCAPAVRVPQPEEPAKETSDE